MWWGGYVWKPSHQFGWIQKLDPVGSTVRDEVMKLCRGVSIGHYEAVAVGNWWYWVSRGHLYLYILHRLEIWTGVTDGWLTDWQTLKDRATQLLIKYKSGALVTQLKLCTPISSSHIGLVVITWRYPLRLKRSAEAIAPILFASNLELLVPILWWEGFKSNLDNLNLEYRYNEGLALELNEVHTQLTNNANIAKGPRGELCLPQQLL